MKTSTKLITVGIIALVVGIGGGIGIGLLIQPQTATTYEVRYGGQYYPGEFLLEGYPELWATYDLNIEHRLFTSGGAGNDALLAGEVDINCGSDSKTVALFAAKPDEMLVIGTIQRGDRYATVIADDASYTNWTDLAGETVGTKFGTGAEQVLLRYFDTIPNISWDNFTWVNAEVNQLQGLLESDQIEAFTAWEPTPSIAVDQGVAKVLRRYGDIALTPASLHTTKNFAYNNTGTVIRFLAAQLDKFDMITGDTANAASIAAAASEARGASITAGAFELIYNTINFQIEFNESIINAIDDTAAFLLAQGKITEIPDIVWDARFVEAAMELQEDFGIPVTGTSAEYNQAIELLVEKYFGIPADGKIVLGIISGTIVFGVVVQLKRRKN